jgi:predicted ester cyclase
MASTSNSDLLRETQDQLNRQDMTMMRALCTEETTCRFPDRTCTGVHEITAYFEESFAAVPDRHLEIIAIAESGADVMMRFRLTGTQTGPFGDLPATGRPLSIDGFEHLVMREGKILSTFVVTDQLQFARQIGMIAPDGSAADRAMKLAFRARTEVSRRLGRAQAPRSRPAAR